MCDNEYVAEINTQAALETTPLFADLIGRPALDVEPTLVAVQAPPPLLAVALPGLLAGTVEAAGVAGALVAAFALPALPAHTLPRRVT